jgi:hypothetical protein
MPLLDHFRPPTKRAAPWDSFQGMWAASITAALNHSLPGDRYRAYFNRHLGSQVEADVAEFELAPVGTSGRRPRARGAGAVPGYAPPAAALAMPAVFPDALAVTVKDIDDGDRLVAVIELVSPANKKEAAERRAFAAKCAASLQLGVGLVVIDVVSTRRANLHNDLVRLMRVGDQYLLPQLGPTFAASYRSVRRGRKNLIDVWPTPLVMGERLPTVPLPLKGGGVYPLDLEATYADARERSGAA